MREYIGPILSVIGAILILTSTVYRSGLEEGKKLGVKEYQTSLVHMGVAHWVKDQESNILFLGFDTCH